MRTVLALLLATALGAVPARAAMVDGVNFPDHIAIDGHTLVLNGAGVRAVSILQIRAYAVGLYLEQPSHDMSTVMDGPGTKVLLIEYLHDGSKERVESSFRDGEKRACGDGECPAADAADFDRLTQAFPAVKVGDTSAYIITPQGMHVTVNNQPIITIDNQDVGHRVLDSFVGAHPPAESLRAQLLGLQGR
jgi:Chalcone isomerase-like